MTAPTVRAPLRRPPGITRVPLAGHAGIDWTNPLTRNLIYASHGFIDSAQGAPRNAVNGKVGSATATTVVSSDRGLAQNFNGSTSHAECALDLSPYTNVAFSFRFWWNTFANNDALLWEYTNNFNNNQGAVVNPNSSSDGLFVVSISSSSSNNYSIGFTRPTAKTWHHLVINTVRHAVGGVDIPPPILDGSPPPGFTVRIATSAGLTWKNDQFYFFSRGGTTLFGSGMIRDFCVWGGRTLSQAEVWDLYLDPQQIYKRLSIRTLPLSTRSTASSSRWFMGA